jgi:hypothetical protein
MEQVLAPKFNFTPKNAGRLDDFDYGEGGYSTADKHTNVGFNEQTGEFHVEIKGLVQPKSDEAQRICKEDLNEIITPFVQDTRTVEQGLFGDDVAPQDLTQVRMGKIVRDKYPDLSDEDQEAVRQHAIAALNLVQQARPIGDRDQGDKDGEPGANTAIVDGVRRFALEVRELDIDLIDGINPFGTAYAVMSKNMNADTLAQVQAAIARKRINMTIEETRDLAKRALKFKIEKGRLPSLTAADSWEKRLAEGVAYLAKSRAQANG